MVPADLPGRGLTFEVWCNWDYVLATNSAGTAAKPLSTPVKLLKQPSGRYKIQMQSTNYGWEYSYFWREPKWESNFEAWVSLNQAEYATEFALTPKDNGYIVSSYENLGTPFQETCYLNCFSEMKRWATLWKTPPSTRRVWTFVPA